MCVFLWVPKELVLRLTSFHIFINGIKEGVHSKLLALLGSEML